MDDGRREPLAAAKAELRAGARAIDLMRAANDFPAFEDAWKGFLAAIDKIWIKVELACGHVQGKFRPWQGKCLRQRRKDPLLRYLKHARNADHHSIQEAVERIPPRRTIAPIGDGAWHIDRLIMVGGDVLEYSGNKPLVQRDIPARIELRPVRDRGEWYQPPTEHLGQQLDRRDPIAVAEIGLRYYEDFVLQTEERFFKR